MAKPNRNRVGRAGTYSPAPGDSRSLSRRTRLAILAIATTILLLGAAGALRLIQAPPPKLAERAGDAAAPATFVGSETCAGCHQTQTELWKASQHKHAMDHATEKTVLGDFSNASFEHFGVQSRFFRSDGKFLVETDGPDGKLSTFQVKYTFGLDPLQQYLIEFADGRLQALSIAWDARPKEKGGQRWFHLYPDEQIRHDDILHWTKLNQNWNFMCSECHSTGVRKNYEAQSNRFATTWAEISVGCEACHGQGSRHVAWAQKKQSWWPFDRTEDPAMGLLVQFAERAGITWPLDPRTGNPLRSIRPAALRKEVETCGLCHARRGQLSENWIPGRSLSDTHVVAPLSRGLYHADGQMRDEVYNYGSFKQSKMFAAGVTCSDCHEPHSAKPRFSGENVCLQCHASDKFSVASHHQHAAVDPPPTCISCHMPVRNYMVVDPRHDHSFRIPRPDSSARYGTPNACNGCHADKTPEWAASAVDRWHGPNRKGIQNYVAAFHAAWNGQPDAARLLAALAADGNAPAFARASALTELGSLLSPDLINLARTNLGDADPMVRLGALDLLESAAPAQLWPLVSPLLADPVRGVRVRAAYLLAPVPAVSRPAADREKFERAAAEYVAAQRLNADRPEARSALGNFLARSGQVAEAESEYKAALQLSAQYAPAAINLADLYRQTNRESDGESVLRSALVESPADAGLHHTLGLTLVRLKRLDDAREELRQAAELEPGRARYAYVYAVALHTSGRVSESIAVLKQNLVSHPQDRDTLSALVSFHREAGEVDAALGFARQLGQLLPADQNVARMIVDLQRGASKSPVQ